METVFSRRETGMKRRWRKKDYKRVDEEKSEWNDLKKKRRNNSENDRKERDSLKQ